MWNRLDRPNPLPNSDCRRSESPSTIRLPYSARPFPACSSSTMTRPTSQYASTMAVLTACQTRPRASMKIARPRAQRESRGESGGRRFAEVWPVPAYFARPRSGPVRRQVGEACRAAPARPERDSGRDLPDGTAAAAAPRAKAPRDDGRGPGTARSQAVGRGPAGLTAGQEPSGGIRIRQVHPTPTP